MSAEDAKSPQNGKAGGKKNNKTARNLRIDRLSPRELVAELDRYIVGQAAAKKTVAIALRNRVRRSRLSEELQREITPKNIIMIGSTGVGKTEIARRLSQLSGAPFIKVEATKYTEVGYVGRDVESMIRDLMASALSSVRRELQEEVEDLAQRCAEEQLLDLLLPSPPNADNRDNHDSDDRDEADDPKTDMPVVIDNTANKGSAEQKLRERLRRMLREGELNDRMVELPAEGGDGPFGGIGLMPGGSANVEIFTNMPEDLSNLGENLQEAFSHFMGGGKRRKARKVRIKKARDVLLQEHREKLVDEETAVEMARDRVQNQGIVFIDEIDKIAVREGRSRGGSGEVSREGVQRDILPIVEGSQVRTRYGMIDTTHILFIAAGAFTLSKPSDLIPELQGRFPLRVELESLTAESLEAILSTPENSLIFQYTKLLETENVELDFRPEALKKLAHIAAEVNAGTEDIGARRLHTVLETLIEDISFAASDYAGQKVVIDAEFVQEKLQSIAVDQDLSRYIL